MASLTLEIAHDPLLLFERAAEPFLDPPKGTKEEPFPSPATLLALRQGGLRDDLIRRAAERGVKGWFDPPICIFHELPEWLGTTERRPCTEVERLVLLGALFREQGGEVFSHRSRKEDYVRAVDRLFGELCSEGVAPDQFVAACTARADRDAFEERRDGELARAYRAYHGRLRERGMRDGRDSLIDCAECVTADPEALGTRLKGRREIRIFGLNDLRGGWRALLRALAESPALDHVRIYTSLELPLEGIAHTLVRLHEPETLATRLFEAEEPSPEPVRVIAAPDLGREVEEVACCVRDLADRGVPLHRIAVISRQARPHVDQVVRALEGVGVPASARRRIGLAEIPVVRAVLGLLDAAADGWTRAGLVELAEHPYFDHSLSPRILNHVGYRERVVGLDAWETHLAQLLERAVASEKGEDETHEEGRRDRPPPAESVREALDGLRAFRERARTLEGSRTLSGWVALLCLLLEDDPWGFERQIFAVPGGRVRLARPDLSGWKALRTLVGEWQEALGRWGAADLPMDAAHFALTLRELLDGDVPLWTEAHRGVLVQEGFAAAYRSFDHVFIVGLEAGAFPTRRPSSPLLDEAERDELIGLGLPLDPAEAWETREAELFRTLVAGARESLTLSYSSLDVSGREVIPSSFVEAVQDVAETQVETILASRVVTPRYPVFFRVEAVDHARRVAKVERIRQTGALSPYNGQIEEASLQSWLEEEFGDGRLWSPTQLEAYAKCPWSYLADRILRMEDAEDPSDDLDPAVRGRILHQVLEEFYKAARAERGGAPVLLREEDAATALEQVGRELDRVLSAFVKNEWMGNPALHPARRAELLRILRKYLTFEIDHNRKLFSNRSKNINIVRTGVVEHELAFENVVLETDGVAFRYRGFIDRVEEGVDERVPSEHFIAAVDYKTTSYSVPGAGDKAAWEDDVVLQVPLYAHALSTLKEGKTVSRIEYRTLKSCGVEHSLQLHAVTKEGALVEDDEARGQMDRALAAVGRHVKAVRGGEFPARPAPSCKCSPFCAAWDVCRVKGGPEKKGW